MEAIAYSKDDDAVFDLGERSLPDGPYAPNYPLLVEYSRDGNVQKVMIPAGALKNGGNTFLPSGRPIWRNDATRHERSSYLYAPTNREAVITDRDGVVLAVRSISDRIEKISMEDGYHLVQVHALDFTDDGDIVLELLRSNDVDYTRDVVRINIKSGEAVSVRKAIYGGDLWFVGVKDGQYVYIEKGQRLVIQSSEAQDPLPLASNLNNMKRLILTDRCCEQGRLFKNAHSEFVKIRSREEAIQTISPNSPRHFLSPVFRGFSEKTRVFQQPQGLSPPISV